QGRRSGSFCFFASTLLLPLPRNDVMIPFFPSIFQPSPALARFFSVGLAIAVNIFRFYFVFVVVTPYFRKYSII
ncbi:hypothetical protein RFX70_05295, partial [Acinetobacter baumannii]|nr:hypothetical protein [Acinetobacter baumannii]